jgi:hypothetical protein
MLLAIGGIAIGGVAASSSLPGFQAQGFAATTSQRGIRVKNESLFLNGSNLGGDPTGVVPANAAFQAAAEMMRNVPNASLMIPPGTYRLIRPSPSAYMCVQFWQGTIEGYGQQSQVFLDPNTPPSSTRLTTMMIGDPTAETTGPLSFRNFQLTANNSVIDGGTINGLGCRHDQPGYLNLHSDDVLFDQMWVYDTEISMGCHKESAQQAVDNLDNQFRNWRVIDCYVNTTGNKAIEFAECTDGWMVRNVIENCSEGPQFIFYCSNCWMIDNDVQSYVISGINLAQGGSNLNVVGNRVIASPLALKGGNDPAIQIRSEPNSNLPVTMSDVLISDNWFQNQVTDTNGLALSFINRTPPSGPSSPNTYESFTFRNNTFDGDVDLFDVTNPSLTTIENMRWTENRFQEGLNTVPFSTCPVSEQDFYRNDFAVPITLLGSGFTFEDNQFSGTFANEGANNRMTKNRNR